MALTESARRRVGKPDRLQKGRALGEPGREGAIEDVARRRRVDRIDLEGRHERLGRGRCDKGARGSKGDDDGAAPRGLGGSLPRARPRRLRSP